MNKREYEQNLQLGLTTFLLSFVLFVGAFYFLERPLDLLSGAIVGSFVLFGCIAVLFTIVFAVTAFKYHEYIEPEVVVEYVSAPVVQKQANSPAVTAPVPQPVQHHWLQLRSDLTQQQRAYLTSILDFIDVFSVTNDMSLSKAKAVGCIETQYKKIIEQLDEAGVLEQYSKGIAPRFLHKYVGKPDEIVQALSQSLGYDAKRSLELSGQPQIKDWRSNTVPLQTV